MIHSVLFLADCILNECITSQTYRPSVTQGVLEGADYILNTTETVATIGTSLWDFIGEYSYQNNN